MKTIGKREVYSSQSAEFIEQAEEGKFLKLIPDTFIIKMEDGKQGYAIRHLNRQDIILIDTSGKGAQDAIKKLVEEGYHVKGIVLTHQAAVEHAYADLKILSEDAGEAKIFVHPVNVKQSNSYIHDINVKNNVFEHFSMSVQDFPSRTGEANVVYSEINQGMVFSGNSALGADYGSEEDELMCPDLENKSKNFSLAEAWRSYTEDFRYFFPYQGKPKFGLSEGEQKDLIIKLGHSEGSGGGNPNL